MTTPPEDRRQAPQPTDNELYALPEHSIRAFIEKERRHDELDRLREVRTQKKVWRIIFATCLVMNLIFIGLATIGAKYYG